MARAISHLPRPLLPVMSLIWVVGRIIVQNKDDSRLIFKEGLGNTRGLHQTLVNVLMFIYLT